MDFDSTLIYQDDLDGGDQPSSSSSNHRQQRQHKPLCAAPKLRLIAENSQANALQFDPLHQDKPIEPRTTSSTHLPLSDASAPIELVESESSSVDDEEEEDGRRRYCLADLEQWRKLKRLGNFSAHFAEIFLFSHFHI